MFRFCSTVFLAATWAVVAPALLGQDLPVIQPAKVQPAKTSEAPSKVETLEEHWQVILIGDERVGFVRSRTTTLPPEGHLPERLRSETETKMSIKRFGQTLSIGVDLSTVETLDGALLSYEYAMGTSPTGTTKSVGTVKGKNLVIETTIAGATQSRTIPWEASVKSPAYQDRLLREERLKPGESKTFKAFLPEFHQVTQIRIDAQDVREVTLPDGTRRPLLKARVSQSVLPTMPMTAWLDDQGQIVLVESDLLGQSMKFFEVTKEEALKEIVGAELDLAVNTLIPATPLENPHSTKKVVYRIHIPGADAATLFTKSDTQQVKALDGETVEVTVTARPVPKTSGRSKPPVEYLKPTPLLQADDPHVRDHLRRAVSPDRIDGDAAIALERYVHEKIETKNFTTAFASAAEVARTLEGDCSEHAVFLAALLRARGIGSRVAVGLVYLPGEAKMGGHMWTEAYLNGTWIPLDATLGRGGIGGGHLTIALSSLADDAPLPVAAFTPLLSLGPDTRIEVVSVER
jgi:hypothetical protein